MNLFPRRTVFEFSHPQATRPLLVKAWSEKGAWRIVRSFIKSMMFGNWALTYDPVALDKVMQKVKLISISGVATRSL